MTGIFDTHAHYDDRAFDEDRKEVIASLRDRKVEYFVNIGASMESSKASLEIAKKYDFAYCALGVHPEGLNGLTESDMEWLKENSAYEKCVAIGEIGLDYYYEYDREEQKRWFVRQLNLAREVKLPVIIHSREACDDTLKIMQDNRAEEIGGVVHCFSYSKEIAQIYTDMGFYIGVGGVLTFKNGRKLREVCEAIPLEKIVLETDCPYLSPEPFRGKRNDSGNIAYVISALAQIKGLSEEEIRMAAFQNACKLYRIQNK